MPELQPPGRLAMAVCPRDTQHRSGPHHLLATRAGSQEPPQGKCPDLLITTLHTRCRTGRPTNENPDHWSLIQVLQPNEDEDDSTNARAEAVRSAPGLNPGSSTHWLCTDSP